MSYEQRANKKRFNYRFLIPAGFLNASMLSVSNDIFRIFKKIIFRFLLVADCSLLMARYSLLSL